jgi:hypothetical protein
MDLLVQTKEKLLDIIDEHSIALDTVITVYPLNPDQAIGKEASSEFVLKQGKEYALEAECNGAKGQAFTDQARAWNGQLQDLLSLDLSHIPNRAVFTASLNALLRSVSLAEKTLHCLDQQPKDCGPKMTAYVQSHYPPQKVGLIGLQPAILQSLADTYGAENIRVLDLNPDNIGQTKHGVVVEPGDTNLTSFAAWCDLGLATGSSLVNGTINTIYTHFTLTQTPILFFGNTISGAAQLLNLPHYCPFGR